MVFEQVFCPGPFAFEQLSFYWRCLFFFYLSNIYMQYALI